MTSIAAAPQGLDQALQLDLGYSLGSCQFPKLGLGCLDKFFVLDDHTHASLDKLPDGGHLAFGFGFGLSLPGFGLSLSCLGFGLLLQDELNGPLNVHTI